MPELAQMAGIGPDGWWLLALFGACVLIGIVAVQAGVGGGVLFVPIVGGLFPVPLEAVRATGLLVALASALVSMPALLRMNMASLRLSLPAALVASVFGVGGAALSFALPARAMQAGLGIAILGICALFVRVRPREGPDVGPVRGDRRRDISGAYWEPSLRERVEWTARRARLGFSLFSGVGLIAGLFGLGAGWANVPIFNLVMGVPIKVAVATSALVIAFTTSPLIWMYYHGGALSPAVGVPAVLGIWVGTRLGVRLLSGARPKSVRRMVIALLLLAGVRSLLRGLGVAWIP